MRIDSDRRYRFPVSAEEFWRALGDVESWPTWWPWLHDFDGTTLVTGARWRGRVRPPLPYSLAIDIHVLDATRPRSVRVEIGGDITGEATLDVADHPEGCEVRLTASLAPVHPVLRVVSGVVPGMARYGHDWVLDTGARQFRSGAL